MTETVPPPRAPRRALRNHISALGGFTGITIALLLTSVVSVPGLIAFLGSAAWADLLVVQSTAGVGAVLVLFGWGVTGPARVAAMDRTQLSTVFRDSILIRLVLIVSVAPIVVLISCLSSRLSAAEAFLGTLAYLLPALGASWVFIGVGSARLMFLLDVAPRIVANLVGLAIAGLTHSVLLYLAIQTMGGVALVIGSSVVVRRRFGRAVPASFPALLACLRDQSAGVLSAIAGSAYTNIPVIFVGAVGGLRRDEVLFAFRVLRIAITAITPLTQFLQGWVPRRDVEPARQLWRIRLALRLAVATAIVTTAGLAILLPSVSTIISGGQIAVSFDVSLAVGIAVGAIAMSQITGLVCLIGLGKDRAVAYSTLAGAAIGLVLMFGLHAVAEDAGVAWSVAVAELVVVAYQCVALAKALRPLNRRAHAPEVPTGSDVPEAPEDRLAEDRAHEITHA